VRHFIFAAAALVIGAREKFASGAAPDRGIPPKDLGVKLKSEPA
jgi:hypothetical protein